MSEKKPFPPTTLPPLDHDLQRKHREFVMYYIRSAGRITSGTFNPTTKEEVRGLREYVKSCMLDYENVHKRLMDLNWDLIRKERSLYQIEWYNSQKIDLNEVRFKIQISNESLQKNVYTHYKVTVLIRSPAVACLVVYCNVNDNNETDEYDHVMRAGTKKEGMTIVHLTPEQKEEIKSKLFSNYVTFREAIKNDVPLFLSFTENHPPEWADEYLF